MLEKFEKIVSWYAANSTDEPPRQLVKNPKKEKIAEVQRFTTQKLPDSFVELYSNFNGEEGDGMGIFLAHSFLSLDEIIAALEISKDFNKPELRTIPNPKEADRLCREIAAEFTNAVEPGKEWFKIEFMCAPNSIGFPYLFSSPSTSDVEKEMYGLSGESEEKVYTLTKEFHDLEKQTYNWDELHFTVFHDGTFEVKRSDFEFIKDIPFTSFPEGAIKKKYFNINWIPIIFDNSGNYIGIDLDPDAKGKVGQVINFGRDEEDMFVIANSWEDFLDFNIKLIEQQPGLFLEGKHIHDIYKGIVIG